MGNILPLIYLWLLHMWGVPQNRHLCTFSRNSTCTSWCVTCFRPHLWSSWLITFILCRFLQCVVVCWVYGSVWQGGAVCCVAGCGSALESISVWQGVAVFCSALQYILPYNVSVTTPTDVPCSRQDLLWKWVACQVPGTENISRFATARLANPCVSEVLSSGLK